MKKIHLTLASWWALTLFVAGCGDRPPVFGSEAPAAPGGPPAPPPTSIEVSFAPGLVPDLAATLVGGA